MAFNFSPCEGSYVLIQFPCIVSFGMKGFHVSASAAIQDHLGPLVYVYIYIPWDKTQGHLSNIKVTVFEREKKVVAGVGVGISVSQTQLVSNRFLPQGR